MEILDQRPPGEPIIEYDEELDAAYRTLDRVLGSIQSADNKALIALTFQGAIVAGLIIVADGLKGAVTHIGPWEITILVFLLAFFGCLCVSTLKLFQTISPRVVPPHSSEHVSELFYWAGIANMKREEFQGRMLALTSPQIHEAVTHITYVNANIASAKFTNLRHAFQGLGLQVVLYVIVVVLAVLRPV